MKPLALMVVVALCSSCNSAETTDSKQQPPSANTNGTKETKETKESKTTRKAKNNKRTGMKRVRCESVFDQRFLSTHAQERSWSGALDINHHDGTGTFCGSLSSTNDGGTSYAIMISCPDGPRVPKGAGMISKVDQRTGCKVTLMISTQDNIVDAAAKTAAQPFLDAVVAALATESLFEEHHEDSPLEVRDIEIACEPLAAAALSKLPGYRVANAAAKRDDNGTLCPPLENVEASEKFLLHVICHPDEEAARRGTNSWPGRSDFVEGIGESARDDSQGLFVFVEASRCTLLFRLKKRMSTLRGKEIATQYSDLVQAVLGKAGPQIHKTDAMKTALAK